MPSTTTRSDLLAALTAVSRLVAGSVTGSAGGGEPVVLSDRGGELVVRLDDVVVKAHAADADPQALAARLRIATDPGLRDVLLAPIPIPGGEVGGIAARAGGRLVTAWPAGEPLRPDQLDGPVLEEAAVLVARLHTAPVNGELPGMDGPSRVRRAVERLRGSAAGPPAEPTAELAGDLTAELPAELAAAAELIIRAYGTLPGWARGGAPAAPGDGRGLVHGDWHFGQLVRREEGWRLIDVDALGLGDPAWDLARPAAWYAAGAIPATLWRRFLGAYQDAGGTAAPRGADPWSTLDIPARALAVQSAALGVVRAVEAGGAMDDEAAAFVGCCQRIARITPRPDVHRLSTLLRTSGSNVM